MKFTLAGLFVLLVVILTVSYVWNEEGFQAMVPISSNPSATSTLPGAVPSSAPSSASPVIAPVPSSTPALAAAPNTIVPPSSENVEVSPSAYDAMTKNQRSSLLRDIQKVVRNELISKRALQPVTQSATDQGNQEENCDRQETTSTAQGKDYKKNSLKSEDTCSGDSSCSPLTDMSKYIRKDQIPCWGCNIDY